MAVHGCHSRALQGPRTASPQPRSRCRLPACARTPQAQKGLLLGLKADLALLAIMTNGNDYLPAIKGVDWSDGAARSRPSVWTRCDRGPWALGRGW
jgi:hypothetical protein